jgi:hypothetical protein
MVKTRRFVCLLLMGSLSLTSTLPVSAAGGLTVYGGKLETSVTPGSNNTYNMEVANTSDAPMDIGVAVKGYGMSPTQDFIALEPKDDASPYSAFALLEVSPATFHLEPGKSQIITVVARISAGIGDGGRYAIVLIQTGASGSGGVGVISAVAARVLLTVSGSRLDTTSQISEVNLVKSTAQQPAAVSFVVTNNGNYHFKPQIQATVRNDNSNVATTSVVAPGWPIIPGYSRQFKLDLFGASPLAAGTYHVDIEVKDESGKLVTTGSFPLVVAEKQDLLPPPTTTSPPTSTAHVNTTPAATPQTTSPLSPSSKAPMATSQRMPVALLAGVAGAAIILTLGIMIGRKRK